MLRLDRRFIERNCAGPTPQRINEQTASTMLGRPLHSIRRMVGDDFLITGFLGEKTVKSSPFGGIWRRSARLDY